MPKSAIAPTSEALAHQNAALRTMLLGALEAIDNQKDMEKGNPVLRAHGRFAVTIRKKLDKLPEIAPTKMRRKLRAKV